MILKKCSVCKEEKNLSDFYGYNSGIHIGKYHSSCKICNNKRSAKYRKTTNYLKDYFPKYYKKNRDRILAQMKEKYRKTKHLTKDKKNEYVRNRYKNIRNKIIDNYGGKCVCCSETIREFLCIDHVGYGIHKPLGKRLPNNQFYKYIIEHNYPNEFQILCQNCNHAKAFYKECPHKTRYF